MGRCPSYRKFGDRAHEFSVGFHLGGAMGIPIGSIVMWDFVTGCFFLVIDGTRGLET